jgi:hypothetical protein
MKIICLDQLAPLQPILIADSAIRPDGRPLFVPRCEVRCEVRVAIRVDRLGKNIARKFANRYWGEWALVNVMRPTADDALWTLGDDAVVQGPWQPLQEAVDVDINGHKATVDIKRDVVDGLVADLSTATTFKTGDIIIMPEVLYSYTPQADTRLLATSENKITIIDFNIK